MRIRSFLLFIVSLCLVSCGSGPSREGFLRIGIDADWAPLDFGPQQPYVNGFAEDLLLEISRYSGMEFEKIPANWDFLLEGMQRGAYDAVFTSLPPYSFNQAKYDFSEPFLMLGPVLIVPMDSSVKKLSKLRGKLVGIVEGDRAELILEKEPEIVVRRYRSPPDLFNGLVAGEITGALHNWIPAVNYVRDLYAEKLKIVTEPLTDAGLRLVAPKGKQEHLIWKFNSSLKHFKKKSRLEKLLKKWQLD